MYYTGPREVGGSAAIQAAGRELGLIGQRGSNELCII